MTFYKHLFTGLFALSLGACSLAPRITVDSISARDTPTSYTLRSGMPEVSNNDLYFQEFSKHFKLAMSARGYQEAAPDKAELLILFSYGLSSGQTTYQTYTTPIYGLAGGQTMSVVETTNNERTVKEVYIPVQQRVVGRETHISSYTTYNAFAALEARINSDKELAPVWKTTVQTYTPSTDLRSIMPALANAASNYIGTNTGKAIELKGEK